MGPAEALEETVENIEDDSTDEDEESEEKPKQWGLLDKLSFGVKAMFLGAAGTVGLFAYLSTQDFFGTQEAIEQAKEEAIRTIEIREEYVLDTQKNILDEQERIMGDQENLKQKQEEIKEKEWELQKREIIINGEKRHIERGEKSLESALERLERERSNLEYERESLERHRARLDSEEEYLKKREEFLDEKEKVFDEIKRQINKKALESKDHCLAFILTYDHNRNYVVDDLDSEISNKFLGGISILSQDYLSSVRYVHNPVVLKKLEQYGITGPVLAVNENTILVCNDEGIQKVIENVPEELLYDFEFSPQGKDGIQEILANRKTRNVSPVSMLDNDKLGGSGFVLGNNYIATAYHVIEGMDDEFTVTFEDGKEIKTSKKAVVAYSKEFDTAVLRLDFEGYSPIVLREDIDVGHTMILKRAPTNVNIAKGETARGHLHCNESVSFNSLLDIEDEKSGPEIRYTDSYLSTIEAFPGDSGSPILDWGGDVVGITSGVYTNKKGSTGIMKIKYLRRLLEQYQKK